MNIAAKLWADRASPCVSSCTAVLRPFSSTRQAMFFCPNRHSAASAVTSAKPHRHLVKVVGNRHRRLLVILHCTGTRLSQLVAAFHCTAATAADTMHASGGCHATTYIKRILNARVCRCGAETPLDAMHANVVPHKSRVIGSAKICSPFLLQIGAYNKIGSFRKPERGVIAPAPCGQSRIVWHGCCAWREGQDATHHAGYQSGKREGARCKSDSARRHLTKPLPTHSN